MFPEKKTYFELDKETTFVVPIKLPLKHAKSEQLTSIPYNHYVD